MLQKLCSFVGINADSMKKLFTLFICTWVIITNLFAQKKSYNICAVAFYNFENLFDTVDAPYKFDEEFLPQGAYAYTGEVYHQKLKNLAQVISEIGTDLTPDGPVILGTAEIENGTVLQDLIAQPAIAQRGYQYVWFDGPDSRGIDVALLYNPNYFKVLFAQAHTVDLNGSELKGGATRD